MHILYILFKDMSLNFIIYCINLIIFIVLFKKNVKK